jgi:hypothetical protein
MHRATVRILFVCVCVMTLCLAANAAGPTTGKFDITFEISIDSNIPAGGQISCTFSAIVEGETTLISDSMTVAGTRTGNHAVCSVGMYYSWMLMNPGTDTVALSYDVTATGSGGLPFRQNSQSGMISVPATGHVTDTFVEVTL